MNTVINFVQKISALLILLVFISLLSCSDDPASPKEKDNVPDPEDIITIGIDGGIIEKDDFTITIPSGTFSKDHGIIITKVTNDLTFADNKLSDSYKLDGLPKETFEPIKIQINNNTQTTENTYLALGNIWFSEVDNDSSVIYELLDVTDSSGIITSYIPPNNFNNLLKTKFYAHPVSYFVGPLLSYSIKESENFKLKSPFSLSNVENTISDILEECLSIVINDLKLPFPLGNKKWEVSIKIQDEVVTGGFTPEKAILNLKRSMVSSAEYNKLRVAIGKKLIELGLWNIIYEYNVIDDRHIVQPGFFNLVAAIQTWSEELFSKDEDYDYPELFFQNFMAPFDGVRKGSPLTLSFPLELKHSYGISALIKFLVEDNRFGMLGISKTFNGIGLGQYPTASLINNIDAHQSEWFPEFFKNYLNDDIYNIPTKSFSNSAHHKWEINGPTDTLVSIRSFFPDLSAKLFHVVLNYAELDSSQNLQFFSDINDDESGLALVVFGIRNSSEMIYLGTSSEQGFEIPNIKAYYDDNIDQFLTVLVNNHGTSPYLDQSEINMDILITPKKQTSTTKFNPNYNKCSITLSTNALMQTVYTSSETLNDSTDIIYNSIVTGSFDGNIFTGTFQNSYSVDTVIVVISDDLSQIKSLTWNGLEEITDDNYRWEKGYSAFDIPIHTTFPNTFEINGSSVCGNVSSIKWVYSRSLYTTTLLDIYCDENSLLRVVFENE